MCYLKLKTHHLKLRFMEWQGSRESYHLEDRCGVDGRRVAGGIGGRHYHYSNSGIFPRK